MSVTLTTYSLVGIEAHPVTITVRVEPGSPRFDVAGMSPGATRETMVRVRGALARFDPGLYDRAVSVTISPPRLGADLDVAVATSLLVALGEVPAESLAGTVVLGALSLKGEIRHVRGVRPILAGAAKADMTRAIVPWDNGPEASHVPGIEVMAASSLAEVVAYLRGGPARSGEPPVTSKAEGAGVDLADLRGLYAAKRALEVAAAGGHHMLLVGQPRSGKMALARRMATILPPLSPDEQAEVTMIHSVGGLLPPSGLAEQRPVRLPHHTVSAVGLVGGGEPIRPGEVSLAHHGVLVLDQAEELRAEPREALRQPLFHGAVTLCRGATRATFPARAMVVATALPCPCGYRGHDARCACSTERVASYQRGLTGPLFDALDIRVRLPPPSAEDGPRETSAAVRERVIAARAIQAARGRGLNANLCARDLAEVVDVDAAGASLLSGAVEQLGLTTAGYVRALRIARTIADLEGKAGPIGAPHLAEAVGLAQAR